MVAWYAHTVAGVCSDAACRVAIKTIDSIGARREAQITTQRFREVCSRESHFYQLARLAIALLVGEVASVASALPNQAMVYKWALPRPWTVCAYGGGWGTGGGIFALRRPRPYRRHCDPHCAKCHRLHAVYHATHGDVWFLLRRGTPRRYVLRETGE